MKFTLISKENQETSEIGWLNSRIKNHDIYEPLRYSVGLAHDCLEHFAFDNVEDEIQAHAAMFFIRYEGGYTNRFGQSIRGIDFTYEWENLARSLEVTGDSIKIPRTKKLDDEMERTITSFIEGGKKILHHYTENKYIDEIANAYRAHFRIGYRKAIKRFKGWASHDIAYLFGRLVEVFEQLNKSLDNEDRKLHINIDMKTLRIQWKVWCPINGYDEGTK